MATHGIRIAGFVFAISACTSQLWAQASLPLYEPFDYPAGNLFGNVLDGTAWTRTGSHTVAPIQIAGGSLNYAGLPASGGSKAVLVNGNNYEDLGLDVAGQSSGTVFASFILNVTYPGNGANGDAIFHFSSAGTGATDYRSLLYVKYGSTMSKFRLGIQASPLSTPVYTAAEYDVGTPVFVAVGYEFVAGSGNDKSSVWVNPPLKQSTPPTPSLQQTVTQELTTLGRVCLRQGQSSSSLNVEFDELRVSASWADVTLPVALSHWRLE